MWSTFARALDAELREDTVIRGLSGLSHQVEAIAVDDRAQADHCRLSRAKSANGCNDAGRCPSHYSRLQGSCSSTGRDKPDGRVATDHSTVRHS